MKPIDSRKRGFTLIEVLVASLLLGMLVTILTMVFNQSAIAWRTGKAGVAQMSKLRRQVSFAQYNADNLLPRIDENSQGQNGLVVSAWDEDGNLRRRAVAKASGSFNFQMPSFSSYKSAGTGNTVTPWGKLSGLQSIRSDSQKSYIVGVHSYGPDAKPNTEDDITSWPEDIQ